MIYVLSFLRGGKHGILSRIALLVLPLSLFASSSHVSAVEKSSGVTVSYGYAVFGSLKYAEDFEHLDYVNPNAPKGGTFRTARTGSFDTLNAFALLGTPPLIAYFVLYDPLMQRSLDEPASYYPLIAKRISFPEDISWVQFELDPRARWHDGRPITPDDVIFTVERLSGTVAPQYRRIGTAIARAEKIDDHSVRLYLSQSNNPTLPTVAAQLPVLPRHYFEGRDLSKSTLEPPLGSGPYRVGRVSAGRWIEMQRVPNYWAKDLPINKGRWNFDVIRTDYYRDQNILDEMFLAGLIDIRPEKSATKWEVESRLPAFRDKELVRVTIPYEMGSFYIGLMMNSRNPILANRRVREAITLAYDFEWVQRVILAGQHVRLTSFFANTEFAASGLPTQDELRLLDPFREDLPPELFSQAPSLPVGGTWSNRRDNLVQAAALLSSAGYRIKDGVLVDRDTGVPVKLRLSAYSPLIDRQVSLFMENLRYLGIEVEFRAYDSAQFRNLLEAFDFDMAVNSPSFPPSTTPGIEMAQYWSSSAAATPHSRNYMGVSMPVVDTLVEEIGRADERQKVVAAMRALDRVLLWQHYAIPMHHMLPSRLGQVPITYWDRFGRPENEPTYNFPFHSMDHWWIDRTREQRLRNGVYRHMAGAN